jgi:4-hydroxy-tetrahydrodipicolinate reductase
MISVGVLGAKGRMGQLLCNLVPSEFSEHATLTAKVGRGDAFASLLETQVVIDVSSASAMSELAKLALKYPGSLPAFIVGSTGWNTSEKAILDQLAAKAPVLVASNFSAGVFVVSEILRKFSPLLRTLGYSPVMVESHHRHKKDAPSGTALTLQKAIDSKHPERIQTHCIRAGEIVGTHQVGFYGPGDRISIEHFAQDRSIFARGALQVALWLAEKERVPHQGVLGIEDYFESLKECIQ